LLKDMTIKTGDAKAGRRPSIKYAVLVLAAITGLVLAYVLTVPGLLADARYFSSAAQSHGDQNEETRKKILDWMAENSAMPDHILAKIYNAAALTGNRDLILAICLVESNFNPVAESDRGAIGLMGIMPGVWMKELKKQGIIKQRDDLYRVSVNIAAGAHVFTTYLEETNDIRKALIRYVGGAPWYAEKVMEAQKQIRLAEYAARVD